MGIADKLKINAIWSGNFIDYDSHRKDFIEIWFKYICLQCEKAAKQGQTIYEANFTSFIDYLDSLFREDNHDYKMRLQYHFGDMYGREEEWYKRFLHPMFIKGMEKGQRPSLFKCDAYEVLIGVRTRLEKENFRVTTAIEELPNPEPSVSEENGSKYQVNFVVDWATYFPSV